VLSNIVADSGWQTFPAGGTTTTYNHNRGFANPERIISTVLYRDALLTQRDIKNLCYFNSSSSAQSSQILTNFTANSVDLQIGLTDGIIVDNSGNFLFTPTARTTPEYRIILQYLDVQVSDPTVIARPADADISSASVVTSLSDHESKPNGTRIRYGWTGGDGSGNFNHTFSGTYTIGGLALSEWQGDGTGFLILEKDGANSDFRIMNPGEVWDSWEETYDSDSYTQSKKLNGSFLRSGRIKQSSYAESSLWFDLDPLVPNVGDFINSAGCYSAGGIPIIQYFEKTDVSNITIYGVTAGTGALISHTIQSGGGGTWSNYTISMSWNCETTKWTTGTPVIG
jgi:hypothetical protein